MRDSKILLLYKYGLNIQLVCFALFIKKREANSAHGAELAMLINIFEDQNNDRSKLSEGQHCWN